MFPQLIAPLLHYYAVYPIVQARIMVISRWNHEYQWRGISFDASDIPSFATIVLQLLAFIVIEDTVLYWGHRSMHHPLLYKLVHKACHHVQGSAS